MKVQKTIAVWLLKKRPPRPIDLVQYDTGIQLVFSLKDFELPPGTSATLYVQKPSGKFVYQEQGITVSDPTITIELENQAITEHGNNVPYQVQLKNGTDLITTFAGIFRIEKSLADSGAVESKTVISAFEAKIQEIIKNQMSPRASAIACEAFGEVITTEDASDDPVSNLRIFGKTTQNGIPSPDSPVPLESVGDSGAICVTVAGKNIFGGDALAEKLITLAGASHNAEKKVVSYNAANISNKVVFSDFKPNTQYTFVLYGKNLDAENPSSNLMVVYEDGSNNGHLVFPVASDYSTLVFTTPEGKTVKELKGVFYAGTSALGYEKCGIFEGVLTEADFEPYSAQTLTVSTPNGLPGIPVTSGGNYTDESGQQWICDEVDFAKGVYVQRVKTKVFDGTESINRSGTKQFSYVVADGNNTDYTVADAVCSHFAYVASSYGNRGTGISKDKTALYFRYDQLSNDSASLFRAFVKEQYDAGNPIVVQYVLAESIETPLSADELSAFAALHTNKPNTTVYNDANAYIGLKYNADTKIYIDNKFAALAAAIVNNA